MNSRIEFRFAGQRRHPAAVRLWAVAIAVTVAAACFAEPDDQRFLEGLRSRRLYSLAESYCHERLRQQDLSRVDRAELTIELIRSHAGHAVNSSPADRGSQWKSAHDAAEQFLAAAGDNPRDILVRVQDALTYLAHGELLRQELEAGSRQAGARDLALGQLREAAKRLEDIDRELTAEIPRRGQPRNDDELSGRELASLQNNVRFQLARTFRNRALCYDKGSDDRIDALTRVLDQHEALRRVLAGDDPLLWAVRVDTIRCQRQLGNSDAARRSITALQSEDAPASVLLDVRAEEVRLQLDAGRPNEALALLRRGREIAGQTSAEFDLAHVETFDALAQAAQDDQQAAQWQKDAVTMRRLIEQTHGPYWGRRANLLLVRSATSSGVAHDLEILISLANETYLKGQLDEAVKAFDKAAARARELDEDSQAFQLAYKAALVVQQRQTFDEASRRFRQLALDMEDDPSAPAAHLLAAWNKYQVVKQDSQKLPEYVALLEEQIATWPSAASSDRGRMWLGQLRASERAWTEAADIYLEVSPANEHFAAAVAAAGRCARSDLESSADDGQETAEHARLAARRFEDLIHADGDPLPERFTAAQQTAALVVAELRLQFSTAGRADVAQLLEAALAGSPDASPAWQTAVRSQLVLALAGQPSRQQQAAAVLAKLGADDPQPLLTVLSGLEAIGKTAPRSSQAEIARLQLQAVELLTPQQNELDANDQLRFQLARAHALAATGQRGEALDALARLAETHATDGAIQERLGDLLLAGDDRESLERALAQWRVVDRGARPRSTRWYRAKYSIALAHYKLSEYYKSRDLQKSEQLKTRAAELLKYLKTTPPGWDSSSMKNEFEQLLKRCQS